MIDISFLAPFFISFYLFLQLSVIGVFRTRFFWCFETLELDGIISAMYQPAPKHPLSADKVDKYSTTGIHIIHIQTNVMF